MLSAITLLPTVLPAHATADFTISANPSSIQAEAGNPVNVTITVTSTGGFTGTMSFSAQAGALYTASFNPLSVTLSSGGQGQSTLSITAAPSCPAPHDVVAKGTSGSLAHTVTIEVTADLCWREASATLNPIFFGGFYEDFSSPKSDIELPNLDELGHVIVEGDLQESLVKSASLASIIPRSSRLILRKLMRSDYAIVA